MKRGSVVILLFILPVLFLPAPIDAEPDIDGKISENEWTMGQNILIELNSGDFVDFTIFYTEENVYFLAIVAHNDPNDKIILDQTIPHDYFGIEFDNNMDEAIMGTESSPDDTIMVNYEFSGASDMFMHSFKAHYDTVNGGISNVEGYVGTNGNDLIYEIKKPLITQDLFGHDIDLINGDVYQIMIAVWDDQPPHSASAYFNKRIDNFQFLQLTVNTTSSSDFAGEALGYLIILMSSGIAVLIIRKGTESFILTNLNYRN